MKDDKQKLPPTDCCHIDNIAERCLTLTENECFALSKFFNEIGYISHETQQEIHDLSYKIDKFLFKK